MLGEELKRRREALGLTLPEVSETTRIGTRFLKAIESNDFGAIPGGFYARSFIRAYAKRVGMDEERAMQLYKDQEGAADIPPPDPVSVGADDAPFDFKESSRTFWPAVIVAVVAALILGTGGWAIYHYFNRPPTQEPAAQTTPPPPAAPSQPAAQQPLPPGLNIALQASSKCWIRYAIDDGKPVSEQLNPGDSREFQARDAFVFVSVGDTTALTMRINNRDAQFPAGTGVVLKKRLVITKDTLGDFVKG